MMGSKQIAKEIASEGFTDEDSLDYYAELIKEYADRKLDEQREIIAKDCFARRSFSIRLQKMVCNAPKPELD